MLLLNNHNVKQIFKTVPLTTKRRGYGTFGSWLSIQGHHHSDPVAAADDYIRGEHPSWRHITFCLDLCDKTSVADELIPCYINQQQGLFLHGTYMSILVECNMYYIPQITPSQSNVSLLSSRTSETGQRLETTPSSSPLQELTLSAVHHHMNIKSKQHSTT